MYVDKIKEAQRAISMATLAQAAAPLSRAADGGDQRRRTLIPQCDRGVSKRESDQAAHSTDLEVKPVQVDPRYWDRISTW